MSACTLHNLILTKCWCWTKRYPWFNYFSMFL